MLEFLKKVLVAVMSVFLIGEDVDLTEPPNALSPAIISDYTLPEPAVEAINPVSIEVPPNSEIQAEDKDIKCLCVAYARDIEGMDLPYPINADQLVPNGTPDEGNGILFDYKGVRHLAVIKTITAEGWFVREANKLPCKVSERIVAYNDPYIIGFVKG